MAITIGTVINQSICRGPIFIIFLLTLSLMELDNIIYNGQNITATP